VCVCVCVCVCVRARACKTDHVAYTHTHMRTHRQVIPRYTVNASAPHCSGSDGVHEGVWGLASEGVRRDPQTDRPSKTDSQGPSLGSEISCRSPVSPYHLYRV